MRFSPTFYSIALLFFLTISLSAQNISISGNVLDSQTNEPLPFANIQVMDKNIGAITNENGEFTLEINNRNSTLQVSYVGYKTLTVNLSSIDIEKKLFFFLTPINIDLQQVTVYSTTSTLDEVNASKLSLQSEKIREISVGMPDILRSVQALPGISANNEFKADFNVRGGNQDENLVLVNGTEVYEPYHIKEAANASVGIFNVDLMRKVNIVTGGFTAKYGDKMSSVLDIEYREGSKEKYAGAASISLAYFDGYAEGPLGKKGSFIIGARKSYMEYVLSNIDYEDINRAQPSFYDFQGVLAYNLTPRNKLLFEFIHANDEFTYDPERTYSTKIENEDNIASYNSTMLSLKSKNVLNSKTLLNGEINFYSQTDNEYRLFLRDYRSSTNPIQHVERLTYDTLAIETIEMNTELHYQANSFYEVQSGFSLKFISYDQHSDDLWTVDDAEPYQGDYGSGYIKAKSYKYAGYVENILSLNKNLTLNLGGRIDYFDMNRDFTVSPRLNLAYKFENGTVLKAAWGNFYQSPVYDQLISSVSSDTNTLSQKATHYILGAEKTFPLTGENNFITLKVEGYYKEYEDLISSYYGVFERLTYSKINDAEGNAKGLDIYTVFNLPSVYAWISYGLLFANENLYGDDTGEYPRYTDQRHTISFVSDFDLGKMWHFGLKAYYGSGFPYTPKTAVKNESGIWEWKSGDRHSENLPAYKRVDIRISKLFNFSTFNIAAFIDVSNIFNFENIQQYEYSSVPDVNQPEPEKVLLWPILPSFGVRFNF